jgi:hypothetical protein
MSRVVVVVALLTGLIAVPSPVGADPGHRRPRITVMKWKEPPVTISTAESTRRGSAAKKS